ncbi:MAG TPA: serine protease [Bdellovibrionota bacterium]|jgi:hypothetical protein|nr:serine protease [Bdellovibrionota bacterium]
MTQCVVWGIRHSLTRLVAAFAALALTQACGLAEVDPDSNSTSLTDLVYYLQSTELVSCDDATTCPAASGALYSVYEKSETEYSFNSCSGTLVRDNVFLTNSHCLSQISGPTQKGCGANIFIHLPRTAVDGYEIRTCLRVLAFQSLDTKHDYALLELDAPTKRQLPTISNEGIPDEAELRAWVIDRQKNSIYAKLRQRKLVNAQDTLFVSNAGNNFSPEIVMVGEKVIHGNSGAAILNERGELVGLVNLFYHNSSFRNYADKLQTFLDASIPPETYFSGGVNLSCFPDFRSDDPKIAAACREEFKSADELMGARRSKVHQEKSGELDLRINSDLAEWAAAERAASALGWQARSISELFTDRPKSTDLVPLPHCYKTRPIEGETIALSIFKVGMVYTPRGQFNVDYRRSENANFNLSIENVETNFQTRVEPENSIETTTIYVLKGVLSIGAGPGDKKEISFTLAPCHDN